MPKDTLATVVAVVVFGMCMVCSTVAARAYLRTNASKG